MELHELQRLVDAARRRDERAFAALVKGHYRLVYSLAYSTVGDWSAAQDVAQETFLVAWTHLDNLRHAGAFPMWIRKIARNLSLNWVRSADYRRKLAERHEQLAEPTATNPEETQEMLDRESRSHVLWQAVQQLSPPVREALVLFYLEGRSVAEASTQLGISENALKLRLHTGRARLRKYYERQVEESLDHGFHQPNATKATTRIMAGLALGPAVPLAGKSIAGTGIGLWLHHLTHEVAADAMANIFKGAIVVNANKAIGAAVVLLLCVGGIYFASTRSYSAREHKYRTLPLSKSSVAGAATSGQPDEIPASIATASGLYTPPNSLDVAKDTTSANAQKNLEATGEMTASAALLQSLENARIADAKDFASIAGQVVDTHGAPVPKASVNVFSTAGGDVPGNLISLLAVRQNPARTMTAVTDSAGRFIVEGIAYEGAASLTASADGYTMKERHGVRVPIRSGEKVTNIRLTLEAGKGLYGRLIAPDGKPVADGVVSLVAFRSRAESPNGMLGTANTDKQGNFHFSLAREGSAFLVTTSLKYGGASFDDVPVGTDELIELKMPASARLTGTITWTNGGAAPNLLVFLTGQANDGHGQRRVPASVYAAKTDESGNYTIESIDTNQSYTATIALKDQSPVSQPEHLPDFVPGATQTWNYAIQELITVRGHVVGEMSGKPLRNVKVAALKDGNPVEDSDTPVQSDGSYELKLTSGPGNYLIYPRLWRIEPQTTGYKYGKAVVLTPDEDAVVELTFIDTATMSIRVVDASNQPMQGLMLGIREGDHTWMPVATTPADGRYTWNGFMPGIESNFVVFENMDEIGSTDPIVSEPGQVYDEQTVVVYGSAGIEANATKPNGEPLANGVVIIRAQYALTRQIERRVNTDATGHFVVSEGFPATAVFLEMDGYADTGSGVDKYSYVSGELTLVDHQVSNLGTLGFNLQDSNITVEP